MKTSHIADCKFSSEWKAPNGKTIFYHLVTMENGDSGSVGKASRYPEDLAIGAEITYELDGSKIKVQQQEYKANAGGGKYKSRGEHKPSDFLGYAYSYAKDLVVAGKTSKEDLKNCKAFAEEIYKHITELLENKKD